jgi:hypothetical protein
VTCFVFNCVDDVFICLFFQFDFSYFINSSTKLVIINLESKEIICII